MVNKTNCLSVCYLHQLRLFNEYKIVALKGLSINFFEQVILKAPLLPNSNIQEDFVTPPQAVYTQLVLWENILTFLWQSSTKAANTRSWVPTTPPY